MDPQGNEIPAAYRDGTVLIWINGLVRNFDLRKQLPTVFATATFRLVELAGNVRFTVSPLRPDGNTARFETHVFELRLVLKDNEFQFEPTMKDSIVPSENRFAPTIPTTCRMSAFLEHKVQNKIPTQNLVVGRLGATEDPAKRDTGRPVERDDSPGSSFVQGVGFSNDCKRIVIRTGRDLLVSMAVDSSDKGVHLGESKTIKLPEAAQKLVLPFFPRGRPLIAVTETPEYQSHFAWLVPGGIMVVRVDRNSSEAIPLEQPLVTGLDNAVKLQFGDNGKILTAVQQTWGGNSLAQVRTWYLNRKEPVQPMTGEKLIAEACRVAGQEAGEARFTAEEQKIWFGDGKPQPCQGK